MDNTIQQARERERERERANSHVHLSFFYYELYAYFLSLFFYQHLRKEYSVSFFLQSSNAQTTMTTSNITPRRLVHFFYTYAILIEGQKHLIWF